MSEPLTLGKLADITYTGLERGALSAQVDAVRVVDVREVDAGTAVPPLAGRVRY
jgi:hypothetical protein